MVAIQCFGHSGKSSSHLERIQRDLALDKHAAGKLKCITNAFRKPEEKICGDRNKICGATE